MVDSPPCSDTVTALDSSSGKEPPTPTHLEAVVVISSVMTLADMMRG